MKAIKDRKFIHNRPNYGSWSDFGDKDWRKRRRKLFKRVRHKLLMQIPLNEEEAYRNLVHIEKDTKMDCTGWRLDEYKSSGKCLRSYSKRETVKLKEKGLL